jgi:hypothetical protein
VGYYLLKTLRSVEQNLQPRYEKLEDHCASVQEETVARRSGSAKSSSSLQDKNVESDPSLEKGGLDRQRDSSLAKVQKKIPKLAPVSHIFCWLLAAALGFPLFAGSPELHFVVHAIVNFGIFVWAVGVFVVSNVVVNRLRAVEGHEVPPEIIETR